MPAEKISEVSAGAQPSVVWQPLLTLLTYKCFRCVQKSPVGFFLHVYSHTYMTVVPTSASFMMPDTSCFWEK